MKKKEKNNFDKETKNYMLKSERYLYSYSHN